MVKKISNIVFSMNRPLQLEAYLEGLYRHMPREQIDTFVIYKVDKFDAEYSNLFGRLPECTVIRESDFHRDFIHLLAGIETPYILFATDDVVYFDSIPFATIERCFEHFSSNIFGFSLRLSPENLAADSAHITEMEVAGEKVYRLKWKKAESRNARYPFELNSTLYASRLVKKIVAAVAKEHPALKAFATPAAFLLRALGIIESKKDFQAWVSTFHNPNTLEGYCYRWCKTHKWQMPDYLYFQKLCASAIQVNRVNTEVANPVDGLGEHTVEELNEMYRKGYRFDIDAIEKRKPKETHVGKEYFKLVRK